MVKQTSPIAVVIATKDRPDDLARTLSQLRGVLPSNCTVLVTDDGSNESVKTHFAERFAEVRFKRHELGAGQSLRRSESFQLVDEPFILQLDDDSAPVSREAIASALDFLQAHPKIGALAFQIFNGPELPAILPQQSPKLHHSFVGCGVLFRRAAILDVGGYRSFFGNEWEEEELAMRLIKNGWALYFYPNVVIHHQVSPQNRNQARTWMRGFRNKLWAMLMHYPLHRLLLEGTWVLVVAVMDAVRLVRPLYFLRGLWEFSLGVPRAVSFRHPMSQLALDRYDALRFRSTMKMEDFENPPRLGWQELVTWFQGWRNRPRQRSVWDRNSGDKGSCETVAFAHEHPQKPKND